MLLKRIPFTVIAALSLAFLWTVQVSHAQTPRTSNAGPDVRPMTIPISIFTEKELKKGQFEEFVQAGRLTVEENKDDQEILSIRSVSNQPIALAILLQDDLSTTTNLQLKNIREFILSLPENSRVMVAYLRGGSLQVRQAFTRDLEKAAKSLRIVTGSSAAAPSSPYDSVRFALSRFDGVPTGRRAVLMVSDGVDISNGISGSSPGLNTRLDRAVSHAQRRGVAIYAFFSTATYTKGGNRQLIFNGQNSLQKFADETGGRAFFSGSGSPVSFNPFFKTLDRTLNRQFALTYLSTHMDSGFYKVEVESTNPEIKIDHPRGYYYSKPKKR